MAGIALDVEPASRPQRLAPAGGDRPPPRLRRDLDVRPADPDPDGTPAWLLHDPIANRYFRLGLQAVDMLALVDGRPADNLAREARRRFGHAVESADADELFAFLRRHHLVEADEVQLQLFRQAQLARPGLLVRALKGYISFRVPLLRPDRFLDATLPYVRWLGSPAALAVLALLGVLGLYLAMRQADVFLATLVQFLSLEGLVQYAAVIVLVKACHEFGHAYAAKARGLRVPTIGVAFIVFWPIAYTDTTDAWKLQRRRDKLAIGAAGVGVELGIAAVALLLWSVAPDGPLRSVLFLLATSTWVLSLLVNLNPLMRFDGYFLFSDLVRMPNLEARAHAMGKWRLRRMLFGLDDPRPEQGKSWLAAYAYAIWTYRLFLFVGIALAVYFLFFKALGVALFAVEIAYFVAAPIYREARQWVARFGDYRLNPAFLRTLVLLAGLGLLLAVPWRETVHAPGYVGVDYRIIYAPEGARLTALGVQYGAAVRPGDVIATFAAPDLEHELRQAVHRRDELLREREALGVDSLRRERALVIRAELSGQTRLIDALERRLAKLTVSAEVAGRVTDLSSHLQQGSWISKGEPLFALRGEAESLRIVAYVDEADVARLTPGARARFVAEPGIWPNLDAEVVEIAPSGLERIEKELMTSSHGGGVDVRVTEADGSVPLRAKYQVVLRPLMPHDEAIPAELRGSVAIQAKPQSLLEGFWIRTLALLRREAGV